MVTFSMEVVFRGSTNNHPSNIRRDKKKSTNLQHLFGRYFCWQPRGLVAFSWLL